MQAYISSLLGIPMSVVDADQVRSDLRIKDQSVENSALFRRGAPTKPLYVDLWREDGEYFYLPRGYTVPLRKDMDVKSLLKVADLRTVGRPAPPLTCRRRLRENQVAPMEALTARGRGMDGLLCLGCGKGKTVVSLIYAAAMRYKTLIVVDRDFLADQWTKEIKRTFWLPKDRVGRIQGARCTVGTNFTVALVHTLSQRSWPEEFFDQFGLVIFDECHCMAAPSFRDIISYFKCERLGLSATPDRPDGLDPVFKLHLGGMKPVYTDISRDRSSTWCFKRLPRLVTEEQEAYCMQPVRGKTKTVWRDGRRVREKVMALMRSRYETMATENHDWFNMIFSDVLRALEKGRNVIVLGGRKKQLEELTEAFRTINLKAGLVTSDTKQEERERVFKEDEVIFATWQLASRALDVPRLDTMFLFFPSTDANFLRQSVGRIDRDYPGRKDPLVVVYSHAYIPSMRKKEQQMKALLSTIDPNAKIRDVK